MPYLVGVRANQHGIKWNTKCNIKELVLPLSLSSHAPPVRFHFHLISQPTDMWICVCATRIKHTYAYIGIVNRLCMCFPLLHSINHLTSVWSIVFFWVEAKTMMSPMPEMKSDRNIRNLWLQIFQIDGIVLPWKWNGRPWNINSRRFVQQLLWIVRNLNCALGFGVSIQFSWKSDKKLKNS